MIVSEPTLPAVQEEIADLEPIEVFNKRTRGGSLEAAAFQPKPKAQKMVKKHVRKMIQSKYTEEEDTQFEEATSLVTRMVKNKKDDEKAPETSSDPQTDIQSAAAKSQQGQTSEDKEEMVIEIAKSLARKLGTLTAHIVKKKVVEDAKKSQKLVEAIQSSVAEKVDEMLMSSIQVKREQETSEDSASEADHSRGNVSNKTFCTIDLDPPSPHELTIIKL